VQLDGSDHAWCEDRGPRGTLLVYVDDATSRLMALCFAAVESTFDYFRATRRYLERHGKPMAFYSDRLGRLAGGGGIAANVEGEGSSDAWWRATISSGASEGQRRAPDLHTTRSVTDFREIAATTGLTLRHWY
jgi:hypothetical protein